ncbi:MAG: amino acid racemase [Rubricoccaceae bacterium]|nr:amino acid racemase [Rubricoccaceae bacterium]
MTPTPDAPSPGPTPPGDGERSAIGVVGGLGPYAGLDLVRALFDETLARTDQEHLPVALLSYPGWIPDRSTWIADRSAPNPVPPLTEILRRLDAAGCTVAGIPCNTAHAPALYDRLVDALGAEGRGLQLLHIVDAIVASVRERVPGAHLVGVLATDSSVENRLHDVGLEAAGMDALIPEPAVQALVQASIFDPDWGLKAQSNPPTARAREVLLDAAAHLRSRGADAVILGCTELPLAVPEPEWEGIPLINSTRALARGLIRASHPHKLRPLSESLDAARALAAEQRVERGAAERS